MAVSQVRKIQSLCFYFPSCTDPADHQLTFEPDTPPTATHYCYRPLIQPYTGQPNSASLRLAPPLPSEGTLLVAHTQDEVSFFNIRIENGSVVFEYRSTDGLIRTLTVDSKLERSRTTYQVDLTTTPIRGDFRLSTVDGTTGQLTEIQRLQTDTAHFLYANSTVFTLVCLGGSLLEYRNYVGTIQNAFYGYNSLLEERNFCTLDARPVGRSDFINFADNDIPRSLAFNRFTLGSHTIEFQGRYQTTSGLLLVAEDPTERYQFFVSTLVADELSVNLRDNMGGFDPTRFAFCDNVQLGDGEWHSISISHNLNPPEGQLPSITATVNGAVNCTVQSAEVGRILPFLIDAPLQFGLTHMINLMRTFIGCVADIRFRKTEDSELFRPNLEAAPRSSDLFNTDFCYHCEAREIGCPVRGRVCMDRGFGVPVTCDCPEGFTGDDCAGERARERASERELDRKRVRES